VIHVYLNDHRRHRWNKENDGKRKQVASLYSLAHHNNGDYS
jgi:hypothetical protein